MSEKDDTWAAKAAAMKRRMETADSYLPNYNYGAMMGSISAPGAASAAGTSGLPSDWSDWSTAAKARWIKSQKTLGDPPAGMNNRTRRRWMRQKAQQDNHQSAASRRLSS